MKITTTILKDWIRKYRSGAQFKYRLEYADKIIDLVAEAVEGAPDDYVFFDTDAKRRDD